MQRILLALGVQNFEKALSNSLNEDYMIIGEALYKEAILKAIKETAPNILILRENLPGNIDVLELIEKIRTQYSNTRVIFIALKERRPGSPFLAHLVTYGVYDIAIGAIEIEAMIDFIKNPRTIADAQIFIPNATTNNSNQEPLFKTKEVVVKSDEIEIGKNKKRKVKVDDYSGERYFPIDILENDTDDDNDDFDLSIDDDSDFNDSLDLINDDIEDSLILEEDSGLENDDDFDIDSNDELDLDDNEDDNELDLDEEELDLDDEYEEDLDLNEDDVDLNEDDDLDLSEEEIEEIEDNIDEFDNIYEEELTDELNLDDDDENDEDNGLDFDPYASDDEIEDNNKTSNISHPFSTHSLRNIKTAENSKDILGNMVDGTIDSLPINEVDKKLGLINEFDNEPKDDNVLKNINFNIPTVNLEKPIKVEKKEKKSPFMNKLIKKKDMSKVEKKHSSSIGPDNRIIKKQKIVSFVSPKVGIGNTQIAFNTALKIATTGAKVLFIETSEDNSTIDYIYNLGHHNKGLDFILAGNNNFMDNTILDNIISISDKKKDIYNVKNGQDLEKELLQKSIRNFPDSFNYLFFSKNFQNNSRIKKQIYNYEKFVETITLLLSQYDYEYIIIDADFNISNLLLPYILKYSSQLYITLTQDVEILDIYKTYLNPYLTKNINSNMNKYILLNKESNVSMNANAVSNFIEENVLASLGNYYDLFLESNLKAIPVLMNKDEKLQLFFDVITKTIIGR